MSGPRGAPRQPKASNDSGAEQQSQDRRRHREHPLGVSPIGGRVRGVDGAEDDVDEGTGGSKCKGGEERTTTVLEHNGERTWHSG